VREDERWDDVLKIFIYQFSVLCEERINQHQRWNSKKDHTIVDLRWEDRVISIFNAEIDNVRPTTTRLHRKKRISFAIRRNVLYRCHSLDEKNLHQIIDESLLFCIY
jgi:hypothetical protein